MTHKTDMCKLNAQISDGWVGCDSGGDTAAAGGVYMVTCSSISVTSAAIGDRSERVKVTWANSG
jgi:hypothetical protein